MSPDPVTAAFAANLRRLRAGRGLTVPALAEQAGITRDVIRNIENGAASTTFPTAWRIAGALGSTVAEMLAPDGGGDCG